MVTSDRASSAGYGVSSPSGGKSFGGPGDSMAKGRAADRGSVKGYAGKAHKGFSVVNRSAPGRFGRPSVGPPPGPNVKDLKAIERMMEEDQQWSDLMTKRHSRGVEGMPHGGRPPSIGSRGPKP